MFNKIRHTLLQSTNVRCFYSCCVGHFVAVLVGLLAAIEITHADITVTGFTFGNENQALSGFQIEGFEDVNLLPGLSIRFSGGILVPQTYAGTLNQVFEPATAPGPANILAGPFLSNTWDGQYALTNGGHGTGITGMSPGNGNFWDFNFANVTEFIFATQKQRVGVGLSNFQSLTPSSPIAPLTNHELLINGISWGILESIPGWQPGIYVRNLYILVTATGSDSISSLTFRNISNADGLVFDKLAILSDADNDGVDDPSDNCPFTYNPDQADFNGDGEGDACDDDFDGDGVLNDVDNCPMNPNADQLDTDGDGQGDVCDDDDDNDGRNDPVDNCPIHANLDQANLDGDHSGDVCDSDDDNDGIVDATDNCPINANPDQEDNDLDTQGDVCDADDDNDGVADIGDNCPFSANPDQADSDGDHLGDACDDDKDNDGIENAGDNCPVNPNPDQADLDGDGHGDACDDDDDNDGLDDTTDNCPVTINPEQDDLDGDHIGDACDADLDGDGILNDADNCPRVSNLGQDNSDDDGQGDACDVDDDNDTVEDGDDNCPLIANTNQIDNDGDHQGDACDGDLDGDGIANEADNCPSIANSAQFDFDGDGAGDVCDADQDNDTVANVAPDLCPNTPLGETVDLATGCTIAQLVPCAGPFGTTGDWRSHGAYLAAVTSTAKRFVEKGRIDGVKMGEIVSAAANSNCGQKK